MRYNEKDIKSVIVSESELGEICDRLAAQMTAEYENSTHELIFVVVLKGSIFFATDLIRRIPLHSSIEVMKVSSYGKSTESSGFIEVQMDLKRDIVDADVVIIEDIIDSGRTLQKLRDLLLHRGAHSVKCCTLLDKPDRRVVDLKADYVGKVIPDVFVVGYGLDYDERYRGLSFVGELDPTVYQD